MAGPKLTKSQRQVLEVVRAATMPVDAITVARKLDTSPQGAVQTLSSLVNHRLLRKGKVRGYMRYEAVSS